MGKKIVVGYVNRVECCSEEFLKRSWCRSGHRSRDLLPVSL